MGNALQVGRTDTTSDLFSEGGFAARNDRWLTPLSLVRSLGHFDLDPCGAPGHDTADEVWTPELVGDGLAMPWTGRVWLNPPYGRTMADWVRALAHHGSGIALIFARTETVLFHELVWPIADSILFLKGRLTFLDPEGGKPIANSGAPSVLIAYSPADTAALASCGLAGHLVRLRKTRLEETEDEL